MSKHQLIIIGLDGATFDVLDPLFATGKLPHLQRLASGGLRTELVSTMPPATLPAWTSFLTGVVPCEHGVSDIFVHPDHSYDLHPASGNLRSVSTFLAELSARGLQVASLGVPGTFPPESLNNGLCIAGFDAPGASCARHNAIWPPSAVSKVRAWGGWRYATFNEMASGNPGDRVQHATDAMLRDIHAKERTILCAFRSQPWDVFFVHLQASDTAGHHLWHAHDPHSPRASAIPLGDKKSLTALTRVYSRLDRLIGSLLAAATPRHRVLVVSDHGMGGASAQGIHLNRWLHHEGYLSFSSRHAQAVRAVVGRGLRSAIGMIPQPLLAFGQRTMGSHITGRLLTASRGAPIDYADTVAFSDELDYAPSIWINTTGRFPRGTVAPQDTDALARRIGCAIEQLRDTNGTCLVKKVHLRQEGPYAHRLPDIRIEPAWPQGYRPSFLTSDGPGPWERALLPNEFAAPKGSGMPGVHRPEGVFIAHGPGLRATEVPSIDIHQAGAVVYGLLDESLPKHVQSSWPQVLNDLIPRPSVALRHATLEKPTGGGGYTPHQRQRVKERLRQLGYL